MSAINIFIFLNMIKKNFEEKIQIKSIHVLTKKKTKYKYTMI